MAFRTALIRLATDLGLVLLIAAIALWAGNYLLIVVAVVLGVAISTPGGAAQAYRLRRSLVAPGIMRQFGPIRVIEHRRNGISSYATFYWAELTNGARVHVDEQQYGALAAAGEQLPDRRPLLRKLLGGQTVHQLPTAVATYSAMGRLLLEVRTPAGRSSRVTPATPPTTPEPRRRTRRERAGGLLLPLAVQLPGAHPDRRLRADRVPRIDDPGVRLVGVVVRALVKLRVGRLVVEHRQVGVAAGRRDPLLDRHDRPARVPDVVHDQDTLAVQQRIGRKLEEHGSGSVSPTPV